MDSENPYELEIGRNDPSVKIPNPQKLSPYDLGDVSRADRALRSIRFLRRLSALKSRKLKKSK